MNRLLSTTVILGALALSSSAFARDDQNMYPLDEAINAPAAKTKLDPSIRLYFGDQQHPKVSAEIGEWQTNKKTNAFNKSDKDACEWVFLSAVLELQGRAKKEGGNAVVNIKSNYKNTERSSETEYMCGNGAFMAGVSLKGTVVKLAD